MEIAGGLPRFANRCALRAPLLLRRRGCCKHCGFAGVAAPVALAGLWAETMGRILALAHGSWSPAEFTVFACGFFLGLRACLPQGSCGLAALLLG